MWEQIGEFFVESIAEAIVALRGLIVDLPTMIVTALIGFPVYNTAVVPAFGSLPINFVTTLAIVILARLLVGGRKVEVINISTGEIEALTEEDDEPTGLHLVPRQDSQDS